MSGSPLHRSWEISIAAGANTQGGIGKAHGRKPVRKAVEKSDTFVLPGKPSNKGTFPAEMVEGRKLAKGNPSERNALRTQRRDGAPSALERIRQAARKDKKQRFTALLHHVYDVGRLRGKPER